MKYFKWKFYKGQMAEIKAKGLKTYLKENGWKIFVGVILFYLVRDSILYILIPYLIYKQVITP